MPGDAVIQRYADEHKEFERQVAAALLDGWDDNESWHPQRVLERLAPRVAAALAAVNHYRGALPIGSTARTARDMALLELRGIESVSVFHACLNAARGQEREAERVALAALQGT